MNPGRPVKCVFLSCLSLLTPLACDFAIRAQSASPVASPPARNHALLIGCTDYPALPEDLWLRGPSSDVALTRELLLDERFGFEETGIRALVHGNAPDSQPTAANIRAAFEGLCAAVQPGDQVFILLSGHGGQQPNLNPDEDPEPDGLDEVFVPEDVTGWSRADRIAGRNVIVDDQIGEWLKRMERAGAFVFLVADTCHAGSINRGVENPPELVRARMLPALHPPAPPPDNRPDRLTGTPTPLDLDLPAGVVCLFAVPSRFAAREQPMPPENGTGSVGVYGRLTYALNAVLSSARGPLTYRELAEQLRWRHTGWSWSPLPYIEGNRLDQAVLGRDSFPDRSVYRVIRNGDALLVNAGLLQQIRPGSVFAVYPPAGTAEPEQLAGHIEVVQANATSARVRSCRFEDAAEVPIDQLPDNGRCELVYRELGDARLPVMAVALDEDETSRATFTAVRAALRAIDQDPRTLVRETTRAVDAEIVVEVSGAHVVARRRGEPGSDPGSQQGALRNGPELADQLAARLTMVARAVNLVRLAEPANAAGQAAQPSAAQQVTIAVQWLDPSSGDYVDVPDPTTLALHEGDLVRVQVVNGGRDAVDVTGLLVESGAAIKPFRLRVLNAAGEPVAAASRRLAAGGGSGFFQVTIRETTLGLENLVVIAAPGFGPEPADFDYLRQDDAAMARSATPPQLRGGVGDQLRQLIDTSLFAGAQTRGPRRRLDAIAIHRVAWNVESSSPPERGGD